MDTALLLTAMDFAARKHRGQRRKDPEKSPYINHPIAVAQLVAGVGGVLDHVTILAAILHDTVEDTDTSFEELEAIFGRDVRDVVAEVTDDKTLPKDDRKCLQIEHASHASVRAKIVKLADKTCNVIDVNNSPPADWSVERRLEFLAWSSSVVAGCRGANAALEAHFDTEVAIARARLVS